MTKASPTNLLSAVSVQGTNALRDIKPPVAVPSGWAWLGWVLAALVLAGLLFWAWRYWQKRQAEVPPIPVIPPHVRAKQKLQAALALIGQPREFCILVSDTVRWYLEERFDFHAPERTTEEFLYELQGTSLLTPDQKSSLGEFLSRCDLVKFAKYEPGEPELRELHASALRLVEETEPVAPPPSPDASSPPPPPIPAQGAVKAQVAQISNLSTPKAFGAGRRFAIGRRSNSPAGLELCSVVGDSWRQQVENLRYSRLKICVAWISAQLWDAAANGVPRSTLHAPRSTFPQ